MVIKYFIYSFRLGAPMVGIFLRPLFVPSKKRWCVNEEIMGLLPSFESYCTSLTAMYVFSLKIVKNRGKQKLWTDFNVPIMLKY